MWPFLVYPTAPLTHRIVLSDDEHGSSSATQKKQAQAIMIFVSLALQQMASHPSTSRGSSSELLTLLLDIAVTREDELNRAGMGSVTNLSRDAIGNVLRIMSAKDFILGTLKVLEFEQPVVCPIKNCCNAR